METKEPCIDCPNKVIDDFGYFCDIACGKRAAWENYMAGYDQALKDHNLDITTPDVVK